MKKGSGGVVVGCELCGSAAKIHCESDGASLCWSCDDKVHGANFLVGKHSRTLLCHRCQSPSPWTSSGPKVPPCLSFCLSCFSTPTSNSSSSPSLLPQTSSNHHHHHHHQHPYSTHDDDDDDVEEEEEEVEDDDDGTYTSDDVDEDEDEDDDDENQVVPWTSTSISSSPAKPPTTSDEDEDDDMEVNGKSNQFSPSLLKRKRQTNAFLERNTLPRL